jgi:hypothetical protein
MWCGVHPAMWWGVHPAMWWGVHPAMSPQVSCKSKGQHLFSFLLYAGCSSGYNSGMGWASSLV